MLPRRSAARAAIAPHWYPIELPVCYTGGTGDSIRGAGKTVEISSRAVRFAGNQGLRVGCKVQLAISWPARLTDGTRLSVLINGKIQEALNNEFYAAIIRHEFRTRGEDRAWPAPEWVHRGKQKTPGPSKTGAVSAP